MSAPDRSGVIQERLSAIEREEGVRVVYAVESGSRAWGFASGDSDWDVRFVYVHSRDAYLSVAELRDVIERPIDDALDLSGWELRKALRLLRKSNPPLLEWLGSPIVYREEGRAAAGMRELAERWHSPRACAWHYLRMAQGNFKDHLRGEEVWIKKYFYVLRPLLAIRWIEEERGVVPTEFATLVETLVPEGPLRRAIEDLIQQKRDGAELDRGPRIDPISEFIESELARHASSELSVPPGDRLPLEPVDALFREVLAEGG